MVLGVVSDDLFCWSLADPCDRYIGGKNMGKSLLTPTIAVDFDGTLCSDAWPEIGELNQPLIDFLIQWQYEGNKVILWTCRENTLLGLAVDWCAEHGLHFDAVNSNLPERVSYYNGNDSRKIGADYYIDDSNAFIINNRLEITPRRKEIWR